LGSLLDSLWLKTEVLIHHIRVFLDAVFGPLDILGPSGAIAVLALLTVFLTKVLSSIFNTKRYKMLKKQFQYWYNIRQEANNCKDPEKAKLLKRNIDQAELNRIYYDYFFEGLMKSLLTTYLPIFLMLAYINEAYKPTNLMRHFGREYVFKIPISSDGPLLIGAVFWFFISILLAYLAWFVLRSIVFKPKETPLPKEET